MSRNIDEASKAIDCTPEARMIDLVRRLEHKPDEILEHFKVRLENFDIDEPGIKIVIERELNALYARIKDSAEILSLFQWPALKSEYNRLVGGDTETDSEDHSDDEESLTDSESRSLRGDGGERDLEESQRQYQEGWNEKIYLLEKQIEKISRLRDEEIIDVCKLYEEIYSEMGEIKDIVCWLSDDEEQRAQTVWKIWNQFLESCDHNFFYKFYYKRLYHGKICHTKPQLVCIEEINESDEGEEVDIHKRSIEELETEKDSDSEGKPGAVIAGEAPSLFGRLQASAVGGEEARNGFVVIVSPRK